MVNQNEQEASADADRAASLTASAADASSRNGIPSATEFYAAIEGLLNKLRFPERVSSVDRAHAINHAIDILERTDAAGGPALADLRNYRSFTDGMQAAAEICGTLAETTYDDSDGFAAATGCEAAIVAVVRQQRHEQRTIAKAAAA